MNHKKFTTKKWFVIHDQTDKDYNEGNENGANINFETKNIKYSDAYILIKDDITAKGGYENIDIVFKICSPFTKCITHINDKHIDTAENIDITMYMSYLI